MTEAEKFRAALAAKQPGMRAFVAKGSRMPHSDVLAGSRRVGWTRIVSCSMGDHRERAEAFARQYNLVGA